MIRVPLSQNKFAIIDDEFSHLLKYKWHFARGCARHNYRTKEKVYLIKMHQVIIGRPLRNLEIDHINGNSLDNRKENLRIVTHRQNCHNLKIHRNGNSPCVYFHKSSEKWRATAQINGKDISIKQSKSKDEVLKAYENFANLHSL